MDVSFFKQAFYTNLQINFIKIYIIFYIKILHDNLQKNLHNILTINYNIYKLIL